MHPSFLQRLAETTRDPLTAAILFAEARPDGCTLAELRQFVGGTHPERVTTYLANLRDVLKVNTLGRVAVMPAAHWPLPRIRSMPGAAQLGLPTADDLVDAMSAAGAATPPLAAAPPPPAASIEIDSRRQNPFPTRVDRDRDRASGVGMLQEGDRLWLNAKLDRLPGLAREIRRPANRLQERMGKMYWWLAEHDPDWLKGLIGDLADSTAILNKAACANAQMTARWRELHESKKMQGGLG